MRISKLIPILCIALLAFTAGNGRKHKTGWEKEHLQGKVKSWKSTKYNAVDNSGHIVKGDTLKQESFFQFDENGNEVQADEKYPLKHESYKTVSTYNDKGELMESKQLDNYTDSNTMTYHTINKYDENGNNVEEDTYMNGEKGSYMRTMFKYNSNGDFLEYNIMGVGDTSNVIEGCKYDDKGNMLEWDGYNDDGKIDGKRVNKYNDNGIITETIMYWTDSLRLTGNGKYDEHGNMLGWVEYNSDGSIKVKSEYKNEYDKTGNKIKEIEVANGRPSTYTEYEIVYY